MVKKISWFAISFLVGIILSIGVITASAYSSAQGSIGYYSANGIDYRNLNRIETSRSILAINVAKGTVGVSRPGMAVIPAGYAGVCARVYNDKGELKTTDEWVYSKAGQTELTADKTYLQGNSPTPCYAEGITRAWNGTDYWTFGSFRTVSLNDYT